MFLGKTVPQVALRWLLQRPPVTSVITGTRTVHQLEDNMGAVGWRLSEEEVSIVMNFNHNDDSGILLC